MTRPYWRVRLVGHWPGRPPVFAIDVDGPGFRATRLLEAIPSPVEGDAIAAEMVEKYRHRAPA